MTDNKHPIMPPAQLVQEWLKATPIQILETDPHPIQLIAIQAAQWGANQELDACCEWLSSLPSNWESTAPELAQDLRTRRRPKPPSLKESLKQAILDGDERLALKLLEQLSDD
jgi:hypothetical protein